jgi:hypothetical protein
MSQTLNTLKNYAAAVIHHWWSILGGFVLVILDIAERALGVWWLPPAWAKWTMAILGLCVAQFLAYKDLAKATAKEASKMQQQIDQLRIKPYSEEHRRITERKIGTLTDPSRALVIYLLHGGQTKLDALRQRCQDAEDIFSDALGRAEREDLIRRLEQLHVGRAGIDFYFDINPAFRSALEDLLGAATAEPHFIT